ncbi:phosphoribosylformylglycinamidine synthase subunit PurL [Candidatus Kaiserbacteria bacterium]|nr:phosphoribosylformylglycinamidine synthase subunit PurL [Candidatus Kaiserbacteria bacterium]
MAERITVFSTVDDARAKGFLRTLTGLFPKTKLTGVHIAAAYTVDAKLSAANLKTAAKHFTNPTTEAYALGTIPVPPGAAFTVEIGFLPGVTDNVGRTAQETIEDATGYVFKEGEAVYSSLVLFFSGALSQKEAEAMSQELFNPLIERATVVPARTGIPVTVPKVRLHEEQRADEVNLDISDEALTAIGKSGIADKDGTRRGPLALSLESMKVIQKYFRGLGRNPRDIEIESLAQTWSEHCKHTIFADPLDEVREGIYRKYIKGATEKIRKQKGKKDFCVSVFKDNSGGIAFDEQYLVTHKVETHNSPSALDPFGGAITGIVGVNRDCLGFGMGAKPIANVYGFCVADPVDTTKLYRDKQKQQPLLPSRRILEGVVKGINHGGNQSGIPTPLGFVAVDSRYRGKPLVFAGTVGLIPRALKGRKLYTKKAQAGDYVVMAGGRVGLDGIHGATFSSESLSSGSPATAVQIGDPITQKKMSDAIVREARDSGLYSSITDNGAGGISCSVAEMAKECGGCIVDIEKVPLKYPGLSPWQIWISESQERMTLAVPKKNWKTLKKIFDRHDVEATVIGTFTDSDRCVVRYKGRKIMDIDMDFLHDGRPVGVQKSRKPVRSHTEPTKASRSKPLGAVLHELLARPNIASTSFISSQYDHEVQGSSVTKPLQGRGRVGVDAGVIQPVHGSQKGVVLSHGFAPWYSDVDTYAMAACSIDTAVRNAVCAGASLEYLAILDNFCWSSSNTPERLYELKRAAEAVYDTAVAYGTPYISGKDSMFNDFRGYTAKGEAIHIAAPPTLLISAIGVVDDASVAQTVDFKMPGDRIYLLGDTDDELGASEYFSLLSGVGRAVPQVHAKKNARLYTALARAIRAGHPASVTPVGRGGVAAALAKSAIGGQLGARVNLRKIPGKAKSADSILFSESQGRVLATVRPGEEQKFERLFKGLSFTCIGDVTDTGTLRVDVPGERIDEPVARLTESHRSTFKNWQV